MFTMIEVLYPLEIYPHMLSNFNRYYYCKNKIAKPNPAYKALEDSGKRPGLSHTSIHLKFTLI